MESDYVATLPCSTRKNPMWSKLCIHGVLNKEYMDSEETILRNNFNEQAKWLRHYFAQHTYQLWCTLK